MDGKGQEVRAQLQHIREILAAQTSALSVGEIAAALRARYAIELEPYAVSYRLRLFPASDIEALGKGKGRRYRLAAGVVGASATRDAQRNSSAAPSSAAHSTTMRVAEAPAPNELDALRAMIREPRELRRYVTYDADWLYAYTPGETFYLSDSERAHLASIGRNSASDRPAGTFARNILEHLLIDLSWASSRLEGNTYSRLDTQNLIEFGQRAEGKDAKEAQMILNHKAAIELLVNESSELRVSGALVRSIHAALAENLMPTRAMEGQLRRTEVRIGSSNYFPSAVPQVIEECFGRIVSTAAAISDPFEQAFFVMVHLPYLQPFNDVNKRTSRLAANIPLIAGNYCPLTFVDVPVHEYVEATLAVYEFRRVELLRDVFVRAYERSCEMYLKAQEASAQPDPIRLRYRDALGTAVAEVVRGGLAPSRSWCRAWARSQQVPAADREAFAETLLALLLDLNDASAARYRIRADEFFAWREKFRPA